MALPPSHFDELENVTLMLLTKRDRIGKNFTYTIANAEESVVYTIVEEELSTQFCDDRRLPLKLRMMYQGGEVLKMERGHRKNNCCGLIPYSREMLVHAPAGNVIGQVVFKSGFFILDENGGKIFDIKQGRDSLFGPPPKAVHRRPGQEVVAHIGRRWMFEPLGDIRPTPLQRWGTRYLLPLSLKEKVLILAMTLYVDYASLSIDPAGHNSMSGRPKPRSPPPQRQQ